MKTEEEDKRKKEILLGINPCIYGLNYHDPAVIVLIDGRVAFGVEEERCNRVKHSKGVFPSEALANCLAYCNLTWDDIDAVVIGYEPTLWMNRLNLELLDIINPYINYESKSLQIRGSEVIEKIIKTNIVETADFVIGDHWGADKRIDDDKGTSVVILSTYHSKPLFERIKHRIECVEIDYTDVIRSNPRLTTSVPYNPEQERFYSLLNTCTFSKAVSSVVNKDEPLSDILMNIVFNKDGEK